MKKWIALLLAVTLLCPLIGCGASQEITLWVVTEETTWDRMNGQAWAVKENYEKEHPGVKIRLDILPTGEQERSAYLQKLRTQIMQGGGPDAYLLPTEEGMVIGDGNNWRYTEVEPLFADVAQAMENGMFLDISGFYDGDESLGKESLNTAVMDAGVLRGSRYVLPLRYDIPVIYGDNRTLEELGFDLSALEKPLPELMQAALDTGNTFLAAGGVCEGSGIFGEWVDYAAGKVSLTEERLAAYMESYQTLLAATGERGRAARIDLHNYIYGAYDEFEGFTVISSDMDLNYIVRYPLYIGSLAQLLDYVPIAQYEESGYAILPLQSDGGGTVATVTYYAAVGSGCKNPQLTYEYLRQFLLEESQWEYNRPTKMNILVGDPPSRSSQDKSNKNQQPGLIESGWPVRTVGSLNPVWEVRRRQVYRANLVGEHKSRMRKIGLSKLDEKWAKILEAPICQVRFPSALDQMLEDALNTLNDPMEKYQPTDVSPRELAKALLWDMRRHVSEG